jgi:transmembrane sensor
MSTRPPDRLDYSVLEEAAHWFALFESKQTDAAQRRDWQNWLDADERNRVAWQQVEHINQRFDGLQPRAASNALRESELSRRRLLKNFVVLIAVGGIGWQAARWPQPNATFKTARGEVRHFRLEDGSDVWLNTASAVDVEFDETQRQIVLREGEILIDTARDKRPFFVTTEHGHLQALGTRFGVREVNGETRLGVEQGTVVASPEYSMQKAHVQAGQAIRFRSTELGPKQKLRANAFGWINDMIVADEMPMGEFIDELNRHYTGHINLSPDVAGLKLVGAYPLSDIDQVLDALAQSHPIRVVRLSPWWRSVQPNE